MIHPAVDILPSDLRDMAMEENDGYFDNDPQDRVRCALIELMRLNMRGCKRYVRV
jgi:hypothetical protein